MNPKLAAAVRDAITERQRQFIVPATGEIFAGIMESDLANALRDRRWRLPRGWLSEVEAEGFEVKQVYSFPGGEVRTATTPFSAAPCPSTTPS